MVASNMKILFLAHRTPYPPDKGDKIRSFHLLSQLARRHNVSLVYWVDDPKDLSHTNVLRRTCRGTVIPVPLPQMRANSRALWSLANGCSLSRGYYGSVRFQRIVERLVKEEGPELIYVFSSAMAQYAEPFRKIPTIVDFVDVDSEKWRELARFSRFPLSQIYRLEHRRLARFEIEISRWAQYSLFVSAAEASLFSEIGGKGEIVTLPNGVVFDFVRLPTHEKVQPADTRTTQAASRPIHLLFVGTMSYFPNADAVLYFAREILPRIRSVFPQVIFDIVGRAPTRAVRDLNASNGVRVHGEVADLHPYLAQAEVSVAPMRISRGVPNKILEAMAVGIPVVATSEAIKGIQANDGEELLLGDTPERFSEQVLRLLSDRELTMRITKRARQGVQERYNWKTIGNQLAELINRIPPGPLSSRRTANQALA
jgi:polysaccharide biosynthesis protein PslH